MDGRLRIICRSGLVAFGFVLRFCVFDAAAADDAALQSKIAAAVEAVPAKSVRLGVHVVDVATGQTLYAHLADQAFKPASNMKLITSATALEVLPDDFVYRTTLAMRGDDLIVVGSGDPSVGDPELAKEADQPITHVFHEWAATLTERGITMIGGDLIVDDTAFAPPFLHPTWDPAQRYQWYSAPVGALTFNDNCIDVTVSPGTAGAAANITVVPGNTYTEIDNRTISGGKQTAVISRRGDDPVYVVSGTVARTGTLKSITVPDPGLFFASALRTSLAGKGIRIEGEIKRARVRDGRGQLPADCVVIGVHTRTLPELLGRMNKDSQSLFAECLLKTVGFYATATTTGEGVGSWETGTRAVRAFLASIDAPLGDEVRLIDGGGLSHENRVTPQLLTHVLCHMARSKHNGVYLASLAVAGEDGTLERRLRSVKGRIRAKTGYIRGVYSLSGYARAESGRLIAFSLLANDARTGSVRSTIDKIAALLVTDG